MLKRIGAYNNLPVTLDELSNASGQQISDLAYQITQGRERRRLNADASEKQIRERWSTILTVTANQSLVGRLSLYKRNADAEVHRIIEYMVRNPRAISKDEAEEWFPQLFGNYGVAGDVYAQWMVKNVPLVKESIVSLRKRIDRAAHIEPQERYWSAVSAGILTGVAAANQLGLVRFDIKRLFDWTVEMISEMRIKRGGIASDALGVLASYLAEFMGGRIVVKRAEGSASWTVLYEMRGNQLTYRVEQDAKRIYLDRYHFRQWVVKNGGDYASIVRDLRAAGALMRDDVQRSLGHGTSYTTAVTTCVELDLNHPTISAQPVLQTVSTEGAKYAQKD